MLIEAFDQRGKLVYEDVCSGWFVGKGKRNANDSYLEMENVMGGGELFGGERSVASAASASRASASRASRAGTAKSEQRSEKGGQTQQTQTVGGAGLTRFQDLAVPSGYGIGEICVVMKQGQGIVGLTSVAKAESSERELGKFGCFSVGIRESFKLRSEEQLTGVEISAGSVLERIRFLTSSGRVSKWIGKKISATPHVEKLRAGSADLTKRGVLYPEDKYIVGFWGWESKTRLVGLGIVNRVIIKQYVFSYYWLKEGEDGGGGGAKIEEENENENKNNSGGKIDPGKEFASIVRMRRSDVESALLRSENFARHLWTSRTVAMDWSLGCLSKFQAVSALTKWFFEAAAFRLVKSFSSGEAEKLVYEGEEVKVR